MKIKEYMNEIEVSTYKRNGNIFISKEGQVKFRNLINMAKEKDELEKIEKAINKLPFTTLSKVDLISQLRESDEALDSVDLVTAVEMLDYVVVMDKLAPRTRYILRDKKYTGLYNKTYRMLVKESKEALLDYVKSETRYSLESELEVENVFNTIPPAIMEFDPTREAIYKKEGDSSLYLNTWTAPSLACLNKENTPNKVNKPSMYLLLDTLLRNLTNYDDKAYEYMMNVLAKAYQYKDFQSSILCLVGAQGTGKGVFEMLLREIFTGNHIGRGDKKHNVFTDSDNSMLKDKLVYFLDEMPIGGDIYEEVKSIVGNGHFPLKELNVNVRSYPNRALFINSFNLQREDSIPFKIAESDRRLSVFDAWMPLKNANGFKDFTDLSEAIDLFRLDSGSGIVEYFAWMLSTWEINHNVLKQPYNNAIRQSWIDAGKDNTEDFYTAVLNKDFSYFEERAGGLMLNGYFISDSIQSIFDGVLDARTSTFTGMFSEIFKENENKEIRDKVMYGKRTRKNGNKGEFIYKLDGALEVEKYGEPKPVYDLAVIGLTPPKAPNGI